MPSWLGENWGTIFAVLAAIGMTVGNVSALPQTNIKRLFAYSSIAQAGYLLVGLATLGFAGPGEVIGTSPVLFFLASYAVANLGAFIAIIAVTNRTGSDLIEDFSGLAKRSPVLALALTLCLISLIGMPPAAGFMAKFYIFSGAAQNGLLWLVIIAVINSVASAFYYLRIVKTMWLGEPASAEAVPSSASLRVALSLSCLGVLFLGIAPSLVMKAAEAASQLFGS
jgi:NADH-quinone oxidoreductase subunit N